MNIYIIYNTWLKTSQLILSVYYQRFRKVLRLHSSDIAKDEKQGLNWQNYHSFSTEMKIAVKWIKQANFPCGGRMKKIRSVCSGWRQCA